LELLDFEELRELVARSIFKETAMRIRLAIFSLSFLLAAAEPIHAQVTTATVYGVVRDVTGAVLPGAGITVTNQGTNFSRDLLTDERGEFAIPALPAGRYSLRIELPGFKVYTNQGLQLSAGQSVRQTFVLEVGQTSESITVSESAPLVETASVAQQESLGMREVSQLPLARRNVVGLVTLAPGVTENSWAQSFPNSRSLNCRWSGAT
jgi:hypothetical protein